MEKCIAVIAYRVLCLLHDVCHPLLSFLCSLSLIVRDLRVELVEDQLGRGVLMNFIYFHVGRE